MIKWRRSNYEKEGGQKSMEKKKNEKKTGEYGVQPPLLASFIH